MKQHKGNETMIMTHDIIDAICRENGIVVTGEAVYTLASKIEEYLTRRSFEEWMSTVQGSGLPLREHFSEREYGAARMGWNAARETE